MRYLTNHSTGKMGYAVARAAAMRGAEVTLIHGPTALQPVRFTEDVPITTAQQMYEAVTSRFDEMDVLVMAAAVADYRPAAVADDKIKKKDGDLSIAVERTPDILGTIGPKKKGQFLCGFSMENAGYAGQLLGQAREKEPRHGGGQQSEGRRCRVWCGYQCCHLHHAGRARELP